MRGYEVRNEAGMQVCTGILRGYFGNVWEIALDRLDHQYDGFLMKFYYKGDSYRIYRRLESAKSQKTCPVFFSKSI